MIDCIPHIEEIGYYETVIESIDELIVLAEQLGQILPSRKNSVSKVDYLSVTNARSDMSLSAKYFDRDFPFHTDGAYLITPPRYVILRAEGDFYNCPTILCKIVFSTNALTTMQKDVWLVNGGRGKFYSSIYSARRSDYILRYDKDCMRPVLEKNNSAELMQNLLSAAPKIYLHWKKNSTVIIDNWKLLHARSDASHVPDRTLQRVWVI
jgi:hypothetical protein